MFDNHYSEESGFEAIVCIGALFAIVFTIILCVSAFANTIESESTKIHLKTKELPKIISHSIGRYGHETIICEDGSMWDEWGIDTWSKRN